MGCIPELSPRESCYNRNRCNHIEGDCYLKNLLIYQFATSQSKLSNQDAIILWGTCSGLEEECKKNCQSTTLF